ncbi:MAG: cation diffusion facilitator family transporter [Bacteroidaceae bacterium]|nr:cation diffusion facilitator family transporter [Bacteroidaceae bacterium]
MALWKIIANFAAMDNRTREIQSVTLWGIVGNILLTAVKFIAGIVGCSAAMIADAVHSASDLVSDIVVIALTRLSAQGRDKSHDYGHGKFETLATAIVSVLLLAVGVEMVIASYEQVCSAVNGITLPVPGNIALWAAVVSIAVKEILYQWTVRVGKRLSSQVVIANAWHHRTDAFCSIGSLVGIGGAILLGGEWTILDPLVGGVISIIIIVVAVKMAVPALAELTETSLPDETEQQILDIARSVEGVNDVHDLKTRQCGPYCIADFHLVVDPMMNILTAHDITVLIEERLREALGAEMQINIHIEPSEDSL